MIDLSKDNSVVISILNKIESDCNVKNWRIEDVHVWPIIRVSMFFYFIKLKNTNRSKIKNSVKTKDSSLFHRLLRAAFLRMEVFFKYHYYITYKFKRLHQVDDLYTSKVRHKVNVNGKEYNKFFSPLIEKNIKSYLLMYYEAEHKSKIDNSIIYIDHYFDLYVQYQKLFKKFRKKKLELVGFDNFESLLAEEEEFKVFMRGKSVEMYSNYFNEYYYKVEFYKRFLRAIRPNKVYSICYYHVKSWPLVIAANLLEIETVELQHGPQTEKHACFAGWVNLPKEGYNSMPRTFYCWDDYSMIPLLKWSKNIDKIKVENFGHPWLDYWKNKTERKGSNKTILYALQFPLSYQNMIPEIIVKAIRQTDFDWVLRLHPSNLGDLDGLKRYLKSKEIFDRVELSLPALKPLPLDLSGSDLVLALSSGVLIEATHMNIKSVVLHQIGLKTLGDRIDNNEILYFDIEKSSEAQFIEFLTTSINSD